MTVICATHHDCVPLLLSDILISKPRPGHLNTDGGHLEIPTYDHVDRRLGPGSSHVVSDLKCKLVILRRNFAVGWSGRCFIARNVLTYLSKKLSEQPSIDEILVTLSEEVPADIDLVGTVVEGETFGSFHWDGTTGAVRRGLHLTAGTGALRLEKSGDLANTLWSRITTDHPVEAACARGINIISQLTRDEIFRGDNLPQYFGGGFDVIYFASDLGFHRVSSVVQLFMSAEIGPPDLRGRRRIRYGSYQTSFWQRFNSGLHVERVDLERTRMLIGELRARVAATKSSISPVWDDIDRGEPAPDWPNFGVVHFLVRNLTEVFLAGSRVYLLPNTDLKIKKKAGMITARFSPNLLDDAISRELLEHAVVIERTRDPSRPPLR